MLQRGDAFAVKQSEIAGVALDLHAGNLLQQRVIQVRGGLLEPAFALARAASGVHVLVSLPPQLDHVADQLGRILQVGVDDDQCVGVDRIDAGEHGMLLAEVAGEEDEARVETVAGELADFVAGRILRPVVHEQEAIVDAIVIVRCQLGVLRERGEPGEQHRQRLLLVVTGYENRHGAFVFVRCLFPLMPDLV